MIELLALDLVTGEAFERHEDLPTARGVARRHHASAGPSVRSSVSE
jgi:hypothetical protein